MEAKFQSDIEYYKRILVQASDPPGGLHCIDLNTGKQLWWFDPDSKYRGHTPAVDQDKGFIYYQTRQRLHKINAATGSTIKTANISNPSGTGMGSGNTLLVNDEHGYYIAAVYNDYVAYGGAVKVYDSELNLVWEVTGLNMNLKSVMAYNDGLLYIGVGNSFAYPEIGLWYAGQLENCRIFAYDITNGNEEWVFNCDPLQVFQLGGRGFIDVIYCNGHIIATTQTTTNQEIYVLNALTGVQELYFTAVGIKDACAPSVLSGGKLFTGSLADNSIAVYTIGTGEFKDWNSYGYYAHTNQNKAHPDSLKTLNGAITFDGLVAGADQGGIIIDGVAYFIKNLNCVKFNPDTLAILDNWTIGSIYDSTPLCVYDNNNNRSVILIKESANQRVIAINMASGERIWNSDNNMIGNLFFCMNYFVYSQQENISSNSTSNRLSADLTQDSNLTAIL